VSFKTRRAKRLKRRNQRKRRATEGRLARLTDGRKNTIERVRRADSVVSRVRWRNRHGRQRTQVVRRRSEAEVIPDTVREGAGRD
jgi:hypothetical protein